jgi:hypothetical protein
MINELGYNIFTRKREESNCEIIKHEVETVDFMIDNKSLLELIINEYNGHNEHNDYMGCFNKGWNSLYEKKNINN